MLWKKNKFAELLIKIKIMKKCIKKNLYAAVDVMAVVAVLLLVAAIAKKSEKMWIGTGASIVMAGVMLVVQGLKGQAKIENETGAIIHTKSEEGCDAVELSAGGSRYDIDGVKNQGTVYKVGNGCHAVACKDGTVRVKSFTGRIANYINGGGVLTIAPDECWDELFKA